jgi:Na+-driven multidrug efflux pump
LYIFGINQAILRALGMQWHVAAIVFACLWCGALPTMTYKAIYKGEGLDAVWRILPLFYSIMQFFLILSFARIDWHLEAQEPMCICAPSKLIATETTPLIG